MKKIIFCLLFSVFSVSVSYSQWQKVANNILGSYDVVYGGAMSSKEGIVWSGLHQLWKSIDSGLTWSETNLNMGNSFISEINFFDQNNGVVCIYDQGVFLTRDGGDSWTNILSINHCLGAAFNRTKNEILVADRDNLRGTASYSSDGGTSWISHIIEPNTYSGAYQLLTRSDGRAYILSRTYGQGAHIFESSDFGVNWHKHQSDVDLDSYSFALDSCNPNQIYIGNEEYNQIDNGYSEIYSSTDNGDTWTSVIQKPTKFFSSACATSKNAVFVASFEGTGIYCSIDKGKNWQSIGGPVSHPDSRMLTILGDNILFSADGQGNIWRLVDNTISSSSSSTSLSTQNIVTKDIYGIIVHVPIIVKPAGELTNLDMMLHYDTTYLAYQWSESIPGRVVDVPGETWKSRSKLHFNASELTDTLIGYAVFKFFPQEIVGVRVIFDSLSYAGAAKSPCGSTLDSVKFVNTSASAIITNSPSLNVSSIQRNDPVLATVKLNPNPTGGKTTFSSNEEIGTVKIEVISQLGVMQKTFSGVLRHGEEITFDMNGLAEGTYYARILKGEAVRIIPIVYMK